MIFPELAPWQIIGIVMVIGFGGILTLIYLIAPTIFYDLFRTYYYKMFITENGTVIKTAIEKQTGQWFIKINKRAYLIPFGNMIKHKCGDVFYVDVKNSMCLRNESPETSKMLDEIRKADPIKNRGKARLLLTKIPYVNRFFTMKQDQIDEIIFANKFRLNPEAILDSSILYILLNQGFTEKILAKPKDMWDVISENMPLIIIALIILVPIILWVNSRGGF